MKENTPSSTANIVARNIALIASTGEAACLVAPETARLNAALVESFSADGSLFLKRAQHKWFQTLFRFYERITIPGLALHQALRKLYIERAVRTSLSEGFEQVVVLGGGLDTLALRLQKVFANVNFLEIDHPATQQVKREAIEKLGIKGENLNFLSVDFTRQTLEEGLKSEPNYRHGVSTVFVCEGVTMYLAASDVNNIFGFIKKQNGRRRFIFTFVEVHKNNKPDFHNSTFLVRLWLKWKNEPFKWGLSKEDLENFLTARGFRLIELASADTFFQKYLKPNRLTHHAAASGENVCVSELSD